jgi:hypothetical protein
MLNSFEKCFQLILSEIEWHSIPVLNLGSSFPDIGP